MKRPMYKYVAYSKATNRQVKEVPLPTITEDMVRGMFGVAEPYGSYRVSGEQFVNIHTLSGVAVDRIFDWCVEWKK